MLPDIGATELLVIAIVALIVVGPKDLPVLLRKLGQWVAKMRGMAAEFRSSFDEMARQSELDELRKEVQAMRSGQFINPLQDVADDPGGAAAQQMFADIETSLQGGSVQFPPSSYQPAADDLDQTLAAPAKPKRKRAPAKAKAPQAAIVEEASPARKPRARRKTAGTAS